MKKDFKILYRPVESRVEGSVLAKLWRGIIQDLDVVKAIPSLIERHVRDEKSTSLKLKNKSTIETDIKSESMSFKVFIYLVQKLLKVKKMTFTVSLEFSNGEVTIHSQEVTTGDIDVIKKE